MRVEIAVAMMIALAFAGCADEQTSQEDPEDEVFADYDASVTDDTGLIRGVVVDETITPIQGATIRIQTLEIAVESNENGAFVIDGLQAGTYFLSTSKPGYADIQTGVTVEAGIEKPDVVKILMERAPGTEPYFTPYDWAGFLGCSVRTPALGLSCPGATSVWPEHDFLVDYDLDRVPDWAVSEMIWESTQVLGGEMSFNIRRTDTNRDATDVEGPSPLALTVNKTLAEAEGFGNGSAMRVIVFTAHLKETEPPACVPETPQTNQICPWGVGLQIDQDFRVYTHVFYNYLPPQDWRFVEDNSVPAPPA